MILRKFGGNDWNFRLKWLRFGILAIQGFLMLNPFLPNSHNQISWKTSRQIPYKSLQICRLIRQRPPVSVGNPASLGRSSLSVQVSESLTPGEYFRDAYNSTTQGLNDVELWVATISMLAGGNWDRFIVEIWSMANLSDGELKSAWLIVVNKCHLKYERTLFGHFQLGICLVSAKLSLRSSVVQSISVGRGSLSSGLLQEFEMSRKLGWCGSY